MKTLRCGLVVGFVLAAAALPADAGWWAPHQLGPIDPSEPVDPQDQPEGFDRPDPWQEGSPETVTVASGELLFLGLDNLWMGSDWEKTVTLTFDFAGDGLPTVSGTGWGYHPMNYTGGSRSFQVSESAANGVFAAVYSFQPQPDWEYLVILNDSNPAGLELSDIQMTSQCVPEPGSLIAGLILALGGFGLGSRHRRGKAESPAQ